MFRRRRSAQGKIDWDESQSRVSLQGDIRIGDLPVLLKGQSWQNWSVHQVDFSAVERADSAILALMLVWAQQAGRPLEIKQLPEELRTLIDLYDLQQVVHLV